MSEEAKDTKEAPEVKKKGGKLPIIIALVVLLGGGGFFGLKMKSGGPKKEPELKLGKEAIPLKEFLVNLNGGQQYLRVDIGFGIKEGAKKEEIEKAVDPISDVFIDILSSKRIGEISTVAGKKALRRELAKAANKVLEQFAEKAEEESKDKKKSDEDEEESKDDKKSKDEKEGDSKPEHPDWDSDEGPVLKVYFKSFATQ